MVTSNESEEDLSRAFELGASDFLRKPIHSAELIARLNGHLRVQEYCGELARKESDAQVTLELTRTLASSLDLRTILLTVVRRISEVVHVNRTSIVLAPEPEDGNVGYVVVTSDDDELSNLRIDLANYPEIQQVLRTQEALTIEDVATHPVLDAVRSNVQSHHIGSMTLLPILWQETSLGVLFLRSGTRRSMDERDLSFCRIVANATAVALRNARIMQSLKDRTQQVTFERFEAERRIRSLERYADLFASLADGIAVLDAEGKLLFANPKAYEILKYSKDALIGSELASLVHPNHRESGQAIWDGFAHGEFPTDVDLRLLCSDGSTIIANLSCSSLVHGEGAVLFTFRDVTEARTIESELVKTKEFLESLIHASPDGIVAANMDGRVILFNEGAERIYGLREQDVVHKKNVRELYADNGAARVMGLLQSDSYGAPGSVARLRLDALDGEGERVPISLSAAMIYEGDEAVATFGIFTDLRDKLKVEERLEEATQKLAMTEKQALIAELAGTAAHELNQPLTSVMGYAELLKRKLGQDTPEHQAADIIVREAERMADIVRKIGKITKYETKSYVGGQKILDLDKSVGDDGNKGAGE